MSTRPQRFRVEHNKAKSSFWYTMVAGNGDTVMTSKTKYDDYDNALRAARDRVQALQTTDLVVEFERDGELYEETYAVAEVGEVERLESDLPRGYRRTRREGLAMPEPSLAVFEANLNPNS